MEVNYFAVRLLSHAAAAVLCVFLLAIVLAGRKRALEDWLLALLVGATAAWQSAHLLEHYLVAVGRESPAAASMLVAIVSASSILAPALLVHLALFWARLPRVAAVWSALVIYPLALLAGAPFAAAALAVAGLLVLWAARASTLPYNRFYLSLAICVLVMAGIGLSGSHSTLAAVASLAPPICFTRFVFKFHVFDLLISRRVLFVFTLAIASAFYLVVVRFLAGWLEAQVEAFGPLVEITLILGAAVTWLPMYEVITRFFSRQNRIYADFGRRVIEEAAGILDLRRRAQYFVDQLGPMFQLRRVMLALAGDPPLAVEYGAAGPSAPETIDKLAGWLAAQGHELAHLPKLPPRSEGAALLSAAGFNYAFPLRYQDRLAGMLLLDTAPRVFLDENETTLLGLSRQISLSIESCRLAESKLALETELLRQEHLATLGKVAATIAHEVKNPLSSIKALAQVMREDAEALERFDRDLAYIIAETDRLNACVQQLLTFSRPLPPPAEEVDLTGLLEGAAEFLSRESPARGVLIEKRIAPGLVLKRSDRHSLQQVVLNLMLNALQASPSGGKVLIEAQEEMSARIRVRITDEGAGIPAEVRDRIFEPFFTTKQQGTGLGLAIVRKNVRHLGGELELETPPANGRGTSVSVILR